MPWDWGRALGLGVPNPRRPLLWGGSISPGCLRGRACQRGTGWRTGETGPPLPPPPLSSPLPPPPLHLSPPAHRWATGSHKQHCRQRSTLSLSPLKLKRWPRQQLLASLTRLQQQQRQRAREMLQTAPAVHPPAPCQALWKPTPSMGNRQEEEQRQSRKHQRPRRSWWGRGNVWNFTTPKSCLKWNTMKAKSGVLGKRSFHCPSHIRHDQSTGALKMQCPTSAAHL